MFDEPTIGAESNSELAHAAKVVYSCNERWALAHFPREVKSTSTLFQSREHFHFHRAAPNDPRESRRYTPRSRKDGQRGSERQGVTTSTRARMSEMLLLLYG